jgi:hypothetical protein
MYDDILERNLKYLNVFNYYEFEKLNYIEKHELLIEKKVILKENKTSHRFICVHDSVPIIYNEIKFDFNNYMQYKGYDYIINPDIINEYYDYLYARIEKENIYSDTFNETHRISKKINLLNNNKKIKKTLTKLHDKHATILSNHEVDNDYLNSDCVQIQWSNWKHFITDNFENELFSYISGKPLNIKNSTIIQIWTTACESTSVLNYCKIELNKLNNTPITEIKENLTSIKSIKESKYPLVFINLEKENLFKKYLKNIGAIDKNYKPVKGVFQPACDGFFRSAKDMQNDKIITSEQIFQTGKNENKFIAMLIKENYLPKTTTKLSNGKNYKNIALNFIEISLENKKEQS